MAFASGKSGVIEEREPISNGAAMAAFLSAGIGAAAMGLLVILHEAGVYSAPSLYAPAGGLSGRTTFAVVVWLLAWVVLHRRWRDRQVNAKKVFGWTVLLVAGGLILLFPPVWGAVG